jgi:hypothetical protein
MLKPCFALPLQEYKAANARIEAICRSVAELSLVAVDRKRTYDVEEFETLQMEHHAQVGGACHTHAALDKAGKQ